MSAAVQCVSCHAKGILYAWGIYRPKEPEEREEEEVSSSVLCFRETLQEWLFSYCQFLRNGGVLLADIKPNLKNC